MLNKVCRKALLGISCLMLILWSSCGSTQKVVYFSDIDSVSTAQLTTGAFKEPIIQNDDILSITVQTIDIAASAALNQAPVLSGLPGNSGLTQISGYLVDKDGNVEMPILGVLKLGGLTTTEAKEIVRAKASKYYKDLTVQVRFANYKVTVLGEVLRPSTYTLPNEKVTVLDAISMAGDLTVFGKRENVLLLRENGNKKDIIRLDLTSSKLLSSPYFYLKQNDVLYIEPTPARFAANRALRNQTISIGLSFAAFALTLIRLF